MKYEIPKFQCLSTKLLTWGFKLLCTISDHQKFNIFQQINNFGFKFGVTVHYL
jgi:hypothetical protein